MLPRCDREIRHLAKCTKSVFMLCELCYSAFILLNSNCNKVSRLDSVSGSLVKVLEVL